MDYTWEKLNHSDPKKSIKTFYNIFWWKNTVNAKTTNIAETDNCMRIRWIELINLHIVYIIHAQFFIANQVWKS